MKKINYIFYSIGLLICSIILISISIMRKKSSNQIEETTTPTEEVVTGTESPEDKPTNENIIEYCAENKTLWFLNAFFGVFLTSIFCNVLFKDIENKETDITYKMFPRRNIHTQQLPPMYVRSILLLIYVCNIGFISYVIYEHRFLRIAGIFLLLSSVLFLYCHYNYFYGTYILT
mgnify:CR=1 FL=1